MISHVVSLFRNLLDRFGVFFRPVTDEEERRLDVVLVQNVEQSVGLFVAPGSVKRNRALLLVRLHAVNRDFALSGRGGNRPRRRGYPD